MNEPDKDFLSGCKSLGGKLLKKDDNVICDFGNGKLGLISNQERNTFSVVDNRVGNGKNVTEFAPVQYIAVDNGGIVVAGGKSYTRINRDKKDIKVFTEIEGSNVYGYEPEQTRNLDFSHIQKREGCPVGSRTDPLTGDCIPDVKMKANVPSSRVPLPDYSSVHWNKNSYVPFILVDDDNAMAKANIGTWINSSDAADISKEFLQCKKPVDIHVEVGKEYRDAKGQGYVDKGIQIGNTTYDRDKLYRIGEEIFGIKIMDEATGKPLRSELGKRLSMKGLSSDGPYSPLVVRGKRKVYYLLNPMGEY